MIYYYDKLNERHNEKPNRHPLLHERRTTISSYWKIDHWHWCLCFLTKTQRTQTKMNQEFLVFHPTIQKTSKWDKLESNKWTGLYLTFNHSVIYLFSKHGYIAMCKNYYWPLPDMVCLACEGNDFYSPLISCQHRVHYWLWWHGDIPPSKQYKLLLMTCLHPCSWTLGIGILGMTSDLFPCRWRT